MSESRDWLILSLRRSKGDWLVWYRTACCGYTSCLLAAGRYTEAEARRDECTGHVLAVPLSAVMNGELCLRAVLPNHERLVEKFRKAGRKKGEET